jgi:hypothetical protein
MAKRHDENKDLRSISRIGMINNGDKTIQIPKGATIGIHMWGKIDYLTKYCNWVLIWNNSAIASANNSSENKTSKRDNKKAKKERQLTNKNTKQLKKK